MRWLVWLWRWWDDRLGLSKSIKPIVEHPVPPNLSWWYVLGSATLIACIVQVVTGVALAFSYVPAPNSAYDSLTFITHEAILGNVVRGLHYFGSSAMVILIGAHMAHVFLTGSYKFPREVNWLTGVILLVLTLGMAFTGQLLRWNQDAYWAVVVGAEQAARAPIVGEILVGPPELGKQADPTIIQADPRPDWYFLWYFALLALLPASIEDSFMVGFPLLVGIVLIALPFVAPAGERSPQRRPWAVAIVVI